MSKSGAAGWGSWFKLEVKFKSARLGLTSFEGLIEELRVNFWRWEESRLSVSSSSTARGESWLDRYCLAFLALFSALIVSLRCRLEAAALTSKRAVVI
jgi:hypothetical protein